MIPFFEIFFVFPFVLFILACNLDIYFPSLQTFFTIIQVILGLYGLIILIIIIAILLTSLLKASFSN